MTAVLKWQPYIHFLNIKLAIKQKGSQCDIQLWAIAA